MAVSQERRRHPRKPVDLAAEVRLGDGARQPARLDQMSIGGSFVETAEVPPFGTAITLHFALPGVREPLTLPAVVRWTSDRGMGVQFGAIGVRETHALSEFLAKLP